LFVSRDSGLTNQLSATTNQFKNRSHVNQTNSHPLQLATISMLYRKTVKCVKNINFTRTVIKWGKTPIPLKMGHAPSLLCVISDRISSGKSDLQFQGSPCLHC